MPSKPPKPTQHSQEEPLEHCKVCDAVITGKPVKKMGNLYCSVYCAEVNRERMENLDMDKIDFTQLGGIFDRFMKTCMNCPFPLKCREVRGICSSYFDELHDYINMRWCCHAIYGLSCMLSDGSVDLATVKRFMARSEEIARERGCVGVSPAILAMAEVELIEDFTYTACPDLPPEPPEEIHEHYLACLNCDERFMAECVAFTEQAEERLPEVDAMIDFPYCGHARFDMGGMLLNPNADKARLKQLIAKAKRIAQEKGYKGGQYRIHYLAVARSLVKP